MEPFGEEALLSHLAELRRDWHDGFKTGKPFDIGAPLDQIALKATREKIWDRARMEKDRQVSNRFLLENQGRS
jgi:hypothetical protein